MSLSATLKRARKAVKNVTKNQSDVKNQMFIRKETDEFDNNPNGALIIVLKDLGN